MLHGEGSHMKIRKEYMIKYIEGIPYLLPYGQGIAQSFRSLRLDADEVFLWEYMLRGYDEVECMHRLCAHLGVGETHRSAVEAKVTDFFSMLEQLQIIDRRSHQLIGPLEDYDLFEVAGLLICYSGPKEYIARELEPFRMDSVMVPANWKDGECLERPIQRVEIVLSGPRILAVGEILMRTPEVIVYADERHYYYLFPQNTCVHEMRVRKNGSKAVIFVSNLVGREDVITREVYEAMYQSFLVYGLAHHKYAISSLSLQYQKRGFLFLESDAEDWSNLIELLSTMSNVQRCNYRTTMVELSGEEARMWNIPWGSCNDAPGRESMHLGGIGLLRQSKTNHAVIKTPSERILRTSFGVVSPQFSADLVEHTIDFCTRLYDVVPIWRLHCNQSPEALAFIQRIVDDELSDET